MPAANTSCDPVPVPVVNEVAEEFWKAWSDPDRDFNMADVEDITKTFLSLPTVKAALAALTVADAHRKIIALQAVERDEAVHHVKQLLADLEGWREGRDSMVGDEERAAEEFLVRVVSEGNVGKDGAQ